VLEHRARVPRPPPRLGRAI